MSESHRCSQCGAEFPANTPAGLCPSCLLQAGFDSQSVLGNSLPPTQITPPTASGFVPPRVEELAPLFPQLEILELLGKGGMGAVYKARQPGLDRLVAIKILPSEISHDPAFAERFQREARALARLSHPHIVAVYDFGETFVVPPSGGPEDLPTNKGLPPKGGTTSGGLCYIVMEFVDGANLRQAMRTGTLTSAEALAIVPQICEALQFAHDEGIVHRDIKPENILIDKRGRVKIADFGLAKLLGQDASDHSLTATHQVMGTLRYMAPEQMQGSREVDHRTDIYSLGVVFYELLTGELPMGKFAPPSKKVQVDVRLDEIVLRALEQDPELRYQHASEVKVELDSIRTTSAPTPTPTDLKDPLDGFRELARFAMTPQPAYGTRVALPMLVLFVMWLAATITAHIIYGQKENYREGLILLVQGGGMLVYVLIVLVLNLRFIARKRMAAEKSERTKTGTGPVSMPPDSLPSRLVQNPADCLLLAAGVACVTAIGVAAWLLAVPAYSSNQVTNSLVRGNLSGISTVLAIYAVLIGISGRMIRRLQARLFVLLVNVIVGLFLPAVIALNVVLELRNIPVWPVAIPFWIGMPAALWCVVTLFRIDVRGAFDVAAEQRRLHNVSNRSLQASSSVYEPRFSRFAIAGAVWALFGLLAIIPTLYFIGLNRVWNGTALLSDVIHSEPPLVFSIFMGALLAIGSGAPIGTTIYGGIAIGHIKRSGGKIIGLPLAVADVLFFPLLVLSGIIAALIAQVVYSMAPHPNAAAVTSAGAIGVLVALVICFFVARAVWRAIHPTGALVVRERSAGAWSVLEIVTTVAVAMTFVLAAVKGICELAQRTSPLDVVAVPVAVLATVVAGMLLIVHQIHRPSGSRAALPELFIAILAACAGSLPWTWVFGDIAGWNFWQGAVFASLNFVFSLFLLTVGSSHLRTRVVVTLLVGLIGFVLVMWFNVGPVSVIGGDWLQKNITRKPGMPGMFIAAALSLLAMIAGSLQLRNAMNVEGNAETSPPVLPSSEPRLSRLAVIGLILVAIGTPIALFDLCAVVDVVVIPTALGQPIATKGPIHTFGHEIRDSIVFSLTALFVAAILSGFGIDQIKRSDGKLYGLRLAVADMLVFPLILLAAIVSVPIGSVLVARHVGIAGPIAGAVIGLLTSFFTGRAVWRAVVGCSDALEQKKPEATIPSPWEVAMQTWWFARSNVSRKVLWVALNCFCAFCMFAFLSFEGSSDTSGNSHFRMGFLDPWLVFESNQGPGKRSVSGVFLAWSWLFGIGAYASGWLLFKLKREPGKSPLR